MQQLAAHSAPESEDVGILRGRHERYDANIRPEGHIREVWLNPENDRALTIKVV